MKKRIVLTSGLALFAMFFGAGNIIYPLELGVQAGNHIFYVTLAFLISGIGLPFLGLFATSLYHGDYWSFFNRLGRIPAFFLITFLILIIGPLFAIPRTETIAFHTLLPFLPSSLGNSYFFSAFYCLLLLALTYRHTKIVDIIGYFLSPVKLILFVILIVAGLMGTQENTITHDTILSSIHTGFKGGYSTMDLLATFFFCTMVYRSITLKAKYAGITDTKEMIKIFLYSCMIGAGILGIVYVGFMLLAFNHSSELQGIETAQLIFAISNSVLGKFGSIFVGICVSFACLVTAIALTEVASNFFYEHIFRKKLPRTMCLLMTIATVYLMSILGFTSIMKIATPILEILYPILIVYCIFNIGMKWKYKASALAVSQ